MDKSTVPAFIPVNTKGKATDLETSVTAADAPMAKHIFLNATVRLKNVHLWHELSGKLSAAFILVDGEGSKQKRPVQPGDYCMIDIPGPGTREGFGYDWVKVLSLRENMDEENATGMVVLQLGACSNPATPGHETAHFFEEGATSTFITRLEGNKVTASYHGRNEVSNTDVKRLTDKIRNTTVAIGAYAGLSELQWQALINAFLDNQQQAGPS